MKNLFVTFLFVTLTIMGFRLWRKLTEIFLKAFNPVMQKLNRVLQNRDNPTIAF